MAAPTAYRPCAGVMLFNPAGAIFVAQRIDTPGPAWQMPQGGVDPGEDPRATAIRELGEETGVRAELVEVVAEHPEWLRYDLPPDLMGRLWKG
ncbi:MAG: RNA pyrophosphohydrolase, partial [Pseudomonadota bacterium]